MTVSYNKKKGDINNGHRCKHKIDWASDSCNADSVWYS